ncbi:coproporphyrinogen III oxidase [Thermoactinomyces mirandus]|uniref:coproporphyrinogen III oxidase n=1 Tax=Thermoactinomyces mirandus TaxID=2756294 RepID=UPI0028AC1273|nr:coproporphyrinogen III oxidase [Thermoactinomyces mirandus]
MSGLEPVFYREIELIGKLFFEEVRVVGGKQEQNGDFHLHFAVQGTGPVFANLTLKDILRDQTVKTAHRREVEAGLNEKEIRKQVKQAISYVLLQALQKATGVEQPWGILTGVRPVKLFHSFLLKGFSASETVQRLQKDYLLHPAKTDILTEIVERQKEVLPDLYTLDQEVSLYIGIPFCPTKCAYCTFPAYAIRGRNGLVESFLAGLHEEIEAVGKWLRENKVPVTNIYFGGGTPTSVSMEQLDGIFQVLKKHIPDYEMIRELTVEAGRPDTLNEEKLELLKAWAVDRISINPQSFQEETLKVIGRHHSVKETLDKFRLARKMGLDNINMDLIIGLPNEDATIFAKTLDTMRELKPDSLTVHTLSFKSGSVMTQNRDRYRVAGRDEVREMVKMARDWAKELGYRPYYLYRQKNILGNQENVGYAFPGKESLYNILIMEEKQTIIGLGCGAVSKMVSPHTGRIFRFPNPKEPKVYNETLRHHIEEKIRRLNEVYQCGNRSAY